ncbi:MAG: magnesium transporter CorA family protein [Solirubrobacterales bacterium]
MEVLAGPDAHVPAEPGAGPVWIALDDPTAEELQRLGHELAIHPLAIQDSVEFGLLPKIEDYPDSALVVFMGCTTREDNGEQLPSLVEVHFHVTREAIVSVQRQPLPALAAALERINLDDVNGPEDALYRALEALAGSFTAPLAELDAEVDAIENRILKEPDSKVRRRLLDMKHSLVALRQSLDRQRNVLAGHRDLLERIPGFHSEEAHDVLRDLYERIALVSYQVETLRELISNALDLYVSVSSQKLNETMKILTVVATFFLPLTFLVGFFGQNFKWMTDRIQGLGSFLVFGLGISVLFVVVLFLVFRRAGFIEGGRSGSQGNRTHNR